MDATALDEDNFTMRRVQRDNPSHFFAEDFGPVWRPDLARMIRRRFVAHAVRYAGHARPSQAVFAVKEPNGSQSADMLSEALPRSRFLFLLRDGRDVVDSELAANLQGAWVTTEFPGSRGIAEAERLSFVEQSAMKWLWRTEVTQRAFAAHRGPKLLLRYEELLQDTNRHLGHCSSGSEAPAGWRSPACELSVSDHDVRAHAGRSMRGPKGFYRVRAGRAPWRASLTRRRAGGGHAGAWGAKLSELGYES